MDGILLFYFLNMVVNFLSQRYSIKLCRFLAICCCRLACTISARSSPTAPPRQRRYREPHGSAHTLRSSIAMSTQDAGPGSPDASDGGEIEDFTLIGRGGRPASRPATGEAPQAPSHSEGGGAALSFAAVAARAAATSPRPDAGSASAGRRPAARRTSPSAEATPDLQAGLTEQLGEFRAAMQLQSTMLQELGARLAGLERRETRADSVSSPSSPSSVSEASTMACGAMRRRPEVWPV